MSDVAKSLPEPPSKRELKVRIYINNVLLREEVVYDIRGNWALNQFTNAIQQEVERGIFMTDEDLETIKNLFPNPAGISKEGEDL